MLKLAWRAFLKAFKDKEGAKHFVEGTALHQKKDNSHLELLSLLQQSGRLIDFLKEDINNYQDAQIGAAVRKIHAECAKTLEEHMAIRPLFKEEEGAFVTISQNYNPDEVKVVGHVKGNPPYKGKLLHKGWKAEKHGLHQTQYRKDHQILFPAEVEIQ